MRTFLRYGLATMAIGSVALIAPVSAADLGEWGGSMKDSPMMEQRGGCYVRGDIGYAWNDDPDALYVDNFDNNGNPHPEFDSLTYDDTWFYEFGLGCSVRRNIRAEVVFGFRDSQDFEGHIPINTTPDDPLLTSVETTTLMLNAFYDFASWGWFTPYVSAGIGFAYHQMDMVVATDPSSPNPQFGDEELNFAWALMLGVSSQLTQSAVLDIGYRYIDMGNANSLRLDVAGFWNPRLDLDDLTAHELKVGVRFDIGHLL